MTGKIYRTAMGKTVDIGALMLQNENTRAVGNMGVNARGDIVNNQNQVIEKRSRQIQRQSQKTTSAARDIPVSTSNASARRPVEPQVPADTFNDLPEDNDLDREEIVQETSEPEPAAELRGGLAAAIAKAKTVQQERMKTPREMARAQGVKKI